MATTIKNSSRRDPDSGAGVVIGILIVVLLAIAFVVFGLPYLRNHGSSPQPAATVSP